MSGQLANRTGANQDNQRSDNDRLEKIRRLVNGPNYFYQGDFYERDGGKHLGNALSLLKELFTLFDVELERIESAIQELSINEKFSSHYQIGFSMCQVAALAAIRNEEVEEQTNEHR